MPERLRAQITAAWADRNLLADSGYAQAVRETIAALDRGELRVAQPGAAPDDDWIVHAWVKQAILLYFAVQAMETIELGPYEWFDKIPLKRDWAAAGVRVVPPATARQGSFIERGAVLMPSYVNIGAWVGGGTMVDTWATVGSCAQIGRNVHLSGGVGIGGVLEPPGATPVIVEDGCFLGSRAIVVEGVRVGREAVLGANVVLTASTPIIDVTGNEPVEYRGRVPARAVVVPGTRTKKFPAGEVQLAAAFIIGQRKQTTDQRTSLNEALRDFGVSV
jgi:2,3,4,5-tetrahydropyridine-2-carboxylate N-succinyltransferase